MYLLYSFVHCYIFFITTLTFLFILLVCFFSSICSVYTMLFFLLFTLCWTIQAKLFTSFLIVYLRCFLQSYRLQFVVCLLSDKQLDKIAVSDVRIDLLRFYIPILLVVRLICFVQMNTGFIILPAMLCLKWLFLSIQEAIRRTIRR